jgi:hypothetical protein
MHQRLEQRHECAPLFELLHLFQAGRTHLHDDIRVGEQRRQRRVDTRAPRRAVVVVACERAPVPAPASTDTSIFFASQGA